MGTGSRPRLVVDASVAIKWLVGEHDSWMAAQLRGADYDLYAPSLLASEVANILWKKARRGEIGREIAARSAAVAARFPLHWSNDEVLLGDAVEISLAIDHLTYDCMYLALARRLRAILVTADAILTRLVASTAYGATVVLLHDFRPASASDLVHLRSL
jgi:predicted nucleic acid-binding protein